MATRVPSVDDDFTGPVGSEIATLSWQRPEELKSASESCGTSTPVVQLTCRSNDENGEAMVLTVFPPTSAEALRDPYDVVERCSAPWRDGGLCAVTITGADTEFVSNAAHSWWELRQRFRLRGFIVSRKVASDIETHLVFAFYEPGAAFPFEHGRRLLDGLALLAPGTETEMREYSIE